MRLIDADALKAEWYRLNNIDEEDRGARFVGYQEIPRLIDNAPTAEINALPSADAVQGEWIHDGQNFKGGLDWCHCSECGCKTSANGLSMYNYCPNCGADMRGSRE